MAPFPLYITPCLNEELWLPERCGPAGAAQSCGPWVDCEDHRPWVELVFADQGAKKAALEHLLKSGLVEEDQEEKDLVEETQENMPRRYALRLDEAALSSCSDDGLQGCAPALQGVSH